MSTAESGKTARGLATRQRLVGAARTELIERQGVLEVDSVASRAEVSVGLIYRHFGSRSGLAQALVDDFRVRLCEATLTPSPGTADGWADTLRTRLERAVQFLYADPLAPVLLTRGRVDGDLASAVNSSVDSLCDPVTRTIAEGASRHLIRNSDDPTLLACTLLGGLVGLMSRCLNDGVPCDTTVEIAGTFASALLCAADESSHRLTEQ